MGKVIKKYDINQCALYKCKNQKRLIKILCCEELKLKDIPHLIKYYSFERDKKGTNEKRTITAPVDDLKRIQKRILKLLQKVQRPDWLISGEKGKSYITNGERHIASDYLLAMDIKKFYDNCTREYVYRFFTEYMLTSRDIASVLSDIVTYGAGIPTGCPTSQLLAYYGYRNMFYEINKIAIAHGCIFTLYVDDMTFSSKKPFNPALLTSEVDIVLRKYGHRPKYSKVKYYSKGEAKPITGTIATILHQLEVPNTLQKKIYDNFKIIKGLVFEGKMVQKDSKKLLESMRGQLQAAKNINGEKFPEINRFVKAIGK